jgi:hypothetical protein
MQDTISIKGAKSWARIDVWSSPGVAQWVESNHGLDNRG